MSQLLMHHHNRMPAIGVGLRHPHYEDALAEATSGSALPVDFLEVHAENFFMEGGAARAVLKDIGQYYPISIHGTALSLGSLTGLNPTHVSKLKKLVDNVEPVLVSDHACFAQAQMPDGPLHLGDLLPIAFDEITLQGLVHNINQVQETLNRSIMIENLSAYISLPNDTMSEAQFLVEACKRSGCQLLLDLNNLVVNATNARAPNIRDAVTEFLIKIPEQLIGEIHLAGCTPVSERELMVDDHSHPVPENVWSVYRDALMLFGPKPTLIEWDTALPSWQTLVAEANQARTVAAEVLSQTCAPSTVSARTVP